MEKYIIETPRLGLRRLTEADLDDLCLILQDAQAMYAYEHAFSGEEVREWLDKQLSRYEKYGFGLWAVELRENGEFVGQCGLTVQETPEGERLEVGYLFRRDRWRRGYATEAAAACTVRIQHARRGGGLLDHTRQQPPLPRGGRAQRLHARERLHEALLGGGYAAYRVCEAPRALKISPFP